MMPVSDPAQIYETHLVPAIFGPLAQILTERAQPRPAEQVLDVACGTGVVARSIARRVGSTGRIVGLDFDPLMIAKARQLAPGIEWQEGDAQRLPIADMAFDLVLCQQGLQFMPDRAAGLSEMHRVLRPGGRVALAIWTELSKSPGQAMLFGTLGARLGIDMSQPLPWSLANEAQVLKLVSTAGFVDIVSSVASLQARFPSGRRFVEILIDGSSRMTRHALAQIPADERAAFIDEVAGRLRAYERPSGLELPMETRIIIGRK